jgi:phospholipid/cholesterol/gamma-HCH transport system substrate-binding protein
MENVKLGIFVLLGLAGLVALLYFIGMKQNLFGKNVPVNAHFRNVSGLRVGNNVRYGGINVGTVRKIAIVNDTSILVNMQVDEKIAPLLKSNDMATLGTDGLMGNRVVNIEPGPPGGEPLPVNGFFRAREALDMDEMLRTLDVTNRNVAAMSEDLMLTVQRISRSVTIWQILEDPSLPQDVRTALRNVREASQRANSLVAEVQGVIREVASSEEGLIALMKDSTLGRDLHAATASLREVGAQAEALGVTLNQTAATLQSDLDSGKGPFQALLRDSSLSESLQRSLHSVESGTGQFNQIMEALRNNFLLKGYFRRKAK